MQAGDRTELIVFERLVRTADGQGGWSEEWSVIGQAWAAAKWLGGDETDRDGTIRTRQRYRFVMPSAAADDLALTVNDRIIWQGDPWNIRERPRRLPQQSDLEIIAETGVSH